MPDSWPTNSTDRKPDRYLQTAIAVSWGHSRSSAWTKWENGKWTEKERALRIEGRWRSKEFSNSSSEIEKEAQAEFAS